MAGGLLGWLAYTAFITNTTGTLQWLEPTTTLVWTGPPRRRVTALFGWGPADDNAMAVWQGTTPGVPFPA